MKNIRYRLLWAFALVACLACYYAIARYQYFQRADRYKELYYLENYIDEERYKNENLLVNIKKMAEREGDTAQMRSIVKEAEVLKLEVSKVCSVLQKISKGLTDYASCNVLANKEAISTLKAFENYIKTQYVSFLPALQNLTEEAYLKTQSVEEARFVAWEVSSRSVACEQAILKKYLTQFEGQQEDLTAVPVVQSTQQTYHEGETYEAQLLMMMPMRFKKGKAKATIHGKPVEVDKNGIAHISFPVGKAGNYTWEGTFSCNYRGRDTTFSIQQQYKVLKK